MSGPEWFTVAVLALLCAGAWAVNAHLRHLNRKDASQ